LLHTFRRRKNQVTKWFQSCIDLSIRSDTFFSVYKWKKSKNDEAAILAELLAAHEKDETAFGVR